ncbi:eIF2a-like protein [Epizootic haematopoietic necrosis virus]|uniref:eIF2A n=1 Tax=Epizootic haematopoietic necrosis virus TaxID=100217 RepID=Q9YKK0_9VIRU|nr:eIF2a-like protein [Epizootic haematopoietic necrosis virus]ACO25251.1 eIF2a-like protein [Epizootic haematopoietic necrosis virus]QNN80060.1 eIF2a-like protein [Epizootic haematopoietic necrosis virus]QNN80859.1 eIF2a-like protein [Epizootic haematopoietic necrosis virus]QNN81259.1 eIF2a-like protein [Epizootic haematopoietic necrosis virus]CAB37351.1 eIF2A [Epizootic haematopoietic necrosis virus]
MAHNRFYSEILPRQGDVTMCRVLPHSDSWDEGVYVSMMEYGNVEGYVAIGVENHRDIRKRFRKLAPGAEMCMTVLRVDREKGYADLDDRAVNADQAYECCSRYQLRRTEMAVAERAAEYAGVKGSAVSDFLDETVRALRPGSLMSGTRGLKISSDLKQLLKEFGAEAGLDRAGRAEAVVRVPGAFFGHVLRGVTNAYDAMKKMRPDSGVNVAVYPPERGVVAVTVMAGDSEVAYWGLHAVLSEVREVVKAAGGGLCPFV